MSDYDDYQTPPSLLSAFKDIDGALFLDVPSLIARVREVSDHFICRFVSLSTGNSRSLQIFCCQHRTTIYNCKACVRFSYCQQTKIATFHSCDNVHTHTMGALVQHRIRNHLTTSQKERIRYATRMGVSAYTLRMQERLTCTKDVLYSARRKEIAELKNNEMSNLFNEM